MKIPWLTEFHRQWHQARGRLPRGSTVAFSRAWDKLLEATQITTANDIHQAEREAEALAGQGRIILVRYRHRFISRIRLPLTQTSWLRELFSSAAPKDLHENSIEILGKWMKTPHPLLAQSWRAWCQHLQDTFASHKNLRPFYWHKPAANDALLNFVFKLTARHWPDYTLVRDADVTLGYNTKTIERCQASLEASLSQLHGRPITLESLGLITTNSKLHFDGPLRLEFPDGTFHEAGSLRHGNWISAADLDRAVQLTTSAKLLLSIENSKTTFPKLIELNQRREALLFASSFPTTAVRLLLSKLRQSLPHFHFGDTDPAGYFILQKLRELTPRPVQPLAMEWRPQETSPRLTEYDYRVIEKLLASSNMGDCHAQLRTMLKGGHKGDFEQETRDVTAVWEESAASVTPRSTP